MPQTWGLAATCRFSVGFHAAVQTTLPEPVSSPEGGKRVCSCPFLWEPSRIALLGLFPSAETCVPDGRRTRPPSLCTFSARPRRVVYALAEINESSALVSVSGLSCLHETKAPHLPAPTGPARAGQCEPLHLCPFSVLTRCLNLTETPHTLPKCILARPSSALCSEPDMHLSHPKAWPRGSRGPEGCGGPGFSY